MNLVSINVNGLRAYYNKGALNQLIDTYNPDILCIQECKCHPEVTENIFKEFNYNTYTNSSSFKNGYAGVVTAIKNDCLHKVINITRPEILGDYGSGRIITLYSDKFILVNVYTLNSGGKEDIREEWNKLFDDYIESLLLQNENLIITGDLNVVASELDYWSDYNSVIDSMPGLYQFEIDHFHKMCNKFNMIDSYRNLYPESRNYSWFSYQGGARPQNHGWRIDYFLCTENFMKNHVMDSKVHSDFEGSDHNPIELILNF